MELIKRIVELQSGEISVWCLLGGEAVYDLEVWGILLKLNQGRNEFCIIHKCDHFVFEKWSQLVSNGGELEGGIVGNITVKRVALRVESDNLVLI